MYTSAVLNTVQRPLHRATFPLEPFSSRLNGCQTEKQLNSLFANENQCGFANYVSRNSRAPLSLHFNTLLRSSAPSSFSVKVSRIPKSAFARTRYSAEPFAVKRETFTTLPSYPVGIFYPFCPTSAFFVVAILLQATGQSGIQIHSVKLKLVSRASETSQPGN